MAWGAAGGSDELISKARGARSLCVMPFRRFCADECVALCTALADNDTLTELLASGHAIGESGAKALGALLSRGVIERLAVGDTCFGGAGVAALAEGLGGAQCALRYLDLEYKSLDATGGAQQLGRLLRLSPSLEELNLARNPLNDAGAAALAQPLRTNALISLDLSESGVSAAAFPPSFANSLRRLRTLKVSRNQTLGDAGAVAIAALAVPALTTLNLEESDVGFVGLLALADVPTLSNLQLGGNCRLGAELRGADAPSLPVWERLARLDTLGLGRCALGDAPALGLAEASARMAPEAIDGGGLRVIEFNSNKITVVGASALLRHCSSLESLRLFDNPLGGDRSAEAVDDGSAGADGSAVPLGDHMGAALVDGASALKSLDLGACGIDASAASALCTALLREAVAPKLVCLELNGNELGAPLAIDMRAQLGEARPGFDLAWREAERDQQLPHHAGN
jgi:hypothetical protein|tara:strand:- start:2988 stop:4358 length:1371 start_codon:yes stop_codon:yes gene_type:complete